MQYFWSIVGRSPGRYGVVRRCGSGRSVISRYASIVIRRMGRVKNEPSETLLAGQVGVSPPNR
ncbi:MAG: hypothetical protein KatS3mg111_0215 [Pirellulaceae bacterium]|nr:MAG: hypothetical protein KatS3mg111_0215 [Pirellulaceae bacterium]